MRLLRFTAWLARKQGFTLVRAEQMNLVEDAAIKAAIAANHLRLTSEASGSLGINIHEMIDVLCTVVIRVYDRVMSAQTLGREWK